MNEQLTAERDEILARIAAAAAAGSEAELAMLHRQFDERLAHLEALLAED